MIGFINKRVRIMSKLLSTKLRYKRANLWAVATDRRSTEILQGHFYNNGKLTPSEKDELLICSRIAKHKAKLGK